MRIEIGGALAALLLGAPASAATTCTIQLRPAAAPTSVGEDFDAIKRVGQDLRDYSAAAGRPLNWLTPERQLALIAELPVAELMGTPGAPVTAVSTPISRAEAIAAEVPSQPGCSIQVMLPQIILERGGLAKRSLRVFGVIRRSQDGARTGSFSGFGTAPMNGFKLTSPADADPATRLVESSYKAAVETFLRSGFRSLK